MSSSHALILRLFGETKTETDSEVRGRKKKKKKKEFRGEDRAVPGEDAPALAPGQTRELRGLLGLAREAVTANTK